MVCKQNRPTEGVRTNRARYVSSDVQVVRAQVFGKIFLIFFFSFPYLSVFFLYRARDCSIISYVFLFVHLFTSVVCNLSKKNTITNVKKFNCNTPTTCQYYIYIYLYMTLNVSDERSL